MNSILKPVLILEGNGTYYHYASGSKYEGQWKNDLQEGAGTFYYASGKKYVGQWSKGKLVKA